MNTVLKKQKNKDNRHNVSLMDFCSQLSISVATGKNWIKLGKVKPVIKNKIICFNQEYVNKLKNEILNDENKILKSRRNKKYVKGNLLYKSYVDENSLNALEVSNVLEIIKQDKIDIDISLIRCLIYEYAIQSILIKYKRQSNIKNVLYKYLNGEIDIGEYKNLFIFNKREKKEYLKIIKENRDIFEVKYQYENNNDIMGLLYISLKSLSDRKVFGIYYTPQKIVKKLNEKLFVDKNIAIKKILDPSCGTGNFLLNLPDSVKFEQIYASDIDEESVNIARLNLAIKYNITDLNELKKHIRIRDYINDEIDDDFDIVLGNPPWGYAYSKEEKRELCKKYYSAEGNNVESFDLFIERSLKILKTDGYLSFILPEALLNVKSHKKIREIILKNFDIKYLEYIGNAFDNVQCPSIIIKLQKTNKKINLAGTEIVIDSGTFIIKKNRPISSEYFSLTMNDLEYDIINKIALIKNRVFLKNNSNFALGIVTGNNEKYIVDRKSKNNELVLRGKDIFKYKFVDSKEYIQFEPENFQQVAPVKFYRADEKLFYRFISNKLVFAYDNKKTLSLNSCNILIPTFKDIDIRYILAILNSRIAQYYFDKNYNSIKILRSHIEGIPIPKVDEKKQKKIIAKVEDLIKLNDAEKILEKYNEIDLLVAKEYNLNNNEYQYIYKYYVGQEMFLTNK